MLIVFPAKTLHLIPGMGVAGSQAFPYHLSVFNSVSVFNLQVNQFLNLINKQKEKKCVSSFI